MGNRRKQSGLGAHMRPETWHGGMWICEAHGESQSFPDDVFSQEQAADQCGVEPEDVVFEHGWWARLSAPGYTDATDWSGPFKTERAAIDYLFNEHNVDAQGEEREEGWGMRDDLDDEDDMQLRRRTPLHGLEQQSPPNRKVHNLYQMANGRWVFRYGPAPFRFQDEEMYFTSRGMAIQAALRNGWVVEDNNRVRKAHHGSINGV